MIVEELVAQLGWDLTGEEDLRKFKSGMADAEKGLSRFVARAGALAVAAGTAFATAMGAFGKSVISVSAEFEGYETSLITLEGSAEKAKASMDWITKFAATTPYELGGVTAAFIKLKSYGIDPMGDTMRILGDTASAMNKPLDQAVEAFADATSFQFERLREFGLIASQKGDEVTFQWTKNGETLTKVVRKNGAEIQKFMLEHFGNSFSGAMLRQSKTWDGMISNLSDSWMIFQKRVGDRGFFENVKSRLAGLLDYIGRLDADGTLGEWEQRLSDGLTWSVDQAIFALSRLQRHFEFISKWINTNPDQWAMVAKGLLAIGAVMFPKVAAIVVLEDVLSALEGGESVIGGFAQSLSELTGIDPGNLTTVLASLAGTAATLFLFGGTFKTVANGLLAIGKALKGLAGAAFAADLAATGTSAGGIFGKAFGIAAKGAIVAAVIAALQVFDPQGNLGGLTKPIDDAIRESLDLPAKDTGITPGEIVDGLGNLFTPAPVDAPEADAQGNIPLRPEQSFQVAPAEPKGILDLLGRSPPIDLEAGELTSTVDRMLAGMQRLADGPGPDAEGNIPLRPDQGIADLQQLIANAQSNLAKTSSDSAAQAVTNTVNDSRDQSVNVGGVNVEVNVQQATQAPAAAGRAVGEAVGKAASNSVRSNSVTSNVGVAP
jgi:hypothetical protein